MIEGEGDQERQIIAARVRMERARVELITAQVALFDLVQARQEQRAVEAS